MTETSDRRRFLSLAGLGAAGAALFGLRAGGRAEAKSFPVELTEAQWRKRLSAQEFAVLRQEATERAFTSPLNAEKHAGTYICAGCDNTLFASKTKFESGTGWPSFYAPLPGAVGTTTDYKLVMPRTEVHCARCGGHLGHVFNDGPKPTGKRFCMNGVAMDFVAA